MGIAFFVVVVIVVVVMVAVALLVLGLVVAVECFGDVSFQLSSPAFFSSFLIGTVNFEYDEYKFFPLAVKTQRELR